MLFFTRSFICIGVIVALAEGVNLAAVVEPARTIADRATHEGVDVVQRLCAADAQRCIALAGSTLAAARAARDLAPRPARSDLPPLDKPKVGRLRREPSHPPGLAPPPN